MIIQLEAKDLTTVQYSLPDEAIFISINGGG